MSVEIGDCFLYVKEELEAVERRLGILLSSEIEVISSLSKYLYFTGGKRFRPALVILFYKLLGGNGDEEAVVDMATALEMIHLATLAHDDVIDAAERRRDMPSLWKRWNNRMAILGGDFIFLRIFRVLNEQGQELRSLVTEAVERTLEGELLQEGLRWRIPTEEEYFQVIERKTAALISASCAAGALLGDPAIPKGRLSRVKEAGLRLGTAYQMIDDLLDIFGDQSLGKPTWKDRDEGWITLPFIQLLELSHGDGAVRSLLEAKELNSLERKELLDQLEEYNIEESFREEAKKEVEEAKELLRWLRPRELKDLLVEMMNFVVERSR